MHRLYVIISANIIVLSIVVLLISLTIIHSSELSIISSSFLMLGIVMLPIGLGIESSTEKIYKIKAEGYDRLMHRLLEEFMVFDKRPIFCPSNICKVPSVLIPISRSTIKVNKVSNRLITLLDDMVVLMLEIPGIHSLRNIIRRTTDLSELNENLNDIITSTLVFASATRVSMRENKYIVDINGIQVDIDKSLGPYNALILLIGGIISEQLGKKILLESFEISDESATMMFKEV